MVDRFINTATALISAHISLADAKPGSPLIIGLHGGGFAAGYHDSGPYSLRALANQQGLSVILLDRPGYGKSHFKAPPAENLQANVVALSDAIGQLWQEYGTDRSGVYLVGHSIGGAIALMIAAAERDWPLVAVSVSGIGVAPPASMPREAMAPPPASGEAQTYVMSDRAMFSKLFFAPGAASDEALQHIEAASFPFILQEVQAIYGVWAPMALATLAAIKEPVQFILAEHDSLWQADEAIMDQIRHALGETARRDIRIFPSVGHCIDYHQEHGDYHQQIIDFIDT